MRYHLLMSDVAQKRDLSDPRTVRDFAKMVKSRKRLDLLTVLTVCVIRGVGPTTWNNWKAMLLRRLYADTADAMEAGLESLNLDRVDLLSSKKGDERKLLLCGWLRNHFPVSTKWCCDTLCMGHTSTATRALHFCENPPRGWGKAKARLVKMLDLFG